MGQINAENIKVKVATSLTIKDHPFLWMR